MSKRTKPGHFGKTVLLLITGLILCLAMAPLASARESFSGSDTYSYQAFIEQGLVPQIQYASAKTAVNMVGASTMTGSLFWDSHDRYGLLGADTADFNQDGLNDLLIYFFGPSSSYSYGDQQPTALYAGLYTHSGQTVNLVGMIELFYDTNVGFCQVYGGIMTVNGRPLLYVEKNTNAYFANGADLSYTWYGFDGTSFRPYYMVGKTDGGSSEIAYSLLVYSDADNYSKQVLWADSSYRSFHPDTMPLTDGEIGDALNMGFSVLGLARAEDEAVSLAGYSAYQSRPETFPTYYNTALLKKSFSYSCKGSGDYNMRQMEIRVTDETGILPESYKDDKNTQASPAPSANAGAMEPAGGGVPQPNSGFAEPAPDNVSQGGQMVNVESLSQGSSGGSTSSSFDPSGYIFPDSNSRYLSQDEVMALSLQGICYAKNEIYARRGRRFVSQELRDYFNTKTWYMGTISPESFYDGVFNSYESQNVALLASCEMSLNASGYPLDQPGYNIYAVGR